MDRTAKDSDGVSHGVKAGSPSADLRQGPRAPSSGNARLNPTNGLPANAALGILHADERLEWVFETGVDVPTPRRRITCLTDHDIKAGAAGDAVRFTIVRGSGRARHAVIGAAVLPAERLSADLPRGSRVVLGIKLDGERTPSVSVYLPGTGDVIDEALVLGRRAAFPQAGRPAAKKAAGRRGPAAGKEPPHTEPAAAVEEPAAVAEAAAVDEPAAVADAPVAARSAGDEPAAGEALGQPVIDDELGPDLAAAETPRTAAETEEPAAEPSPPVAEEQAAEPVAAEQVAEPVLAQPAAEPAEPVAAQPAAEPAPPVVEEPAPEPAPPVAETAAPPVAEAAATEPPSAEAPAKRPGPASAAALGLAPAAPAKSSAPATAATASPPEPPITESAPEAAQRGAALDLVRRPVECPPAERSDDALLTRESVALEASVQADEPDAVSLGGAAVMPVLEFEWTDARPAPPQGAAATAAPPEPPPEAPGPAPDGAGLMPARRTPNGGSHAGGPAPPGRTSVTDRSRRDGAAGIHRRRRAVFGIALIALFAPVVALAAFRGHPAQGLATPSASVKGSALSAYESLDPNDAAVKAKLRAAAVARGIPPEIIYAVAYCESSWRQFDADGHPLMSPTGDIGIMQVHPSSSYDVARLGSDIDYNIAAGADILRGKFRAMPKIGDGSSLNYENWFYAVWAYNGWRANNAYPYRVWQDIASGPDGLWTGVRVTPVPKTWLLDGLGVSVPTPRPTRVWISQ